MKKSAFLLGAAFIAVVLSGCSREALIAVLRVAAQPDYNYNGNINTNAYGYGVHSDQYGRPTSFEVVGQPYENTSHLQVQQNAYGLGVHADQYGRPVRTIQGF
jgi:capsid protein